MLSEGKPLNHPAGLHSVDHRVGVKQTTHFGHPLGIETDVGDIGTPNTIRYEGVQKVYIRFVLQVVIVIVVPQIDVVGWVREDRVHLIQHRHFGVHHLPEISV